VDDRLRATNWQHWIEFCSGARRDPYLVNDSKEVQQNLLIAFTQRVRRGYYGRGARVQAQTPETALRHVAQTLVLAGYPDPRRSYGAKELDLPFSRLLHSYKTDDPPPHPQLALPVSAIESIVVYQHQRRTRIHTVLADLLTLAFFFLLRPGEYCFPNGRTRTRTVQFRRQDIRLYKDGNVLSHTLPLATLLTADGVRLYLDNQKNGTRGATMYHDSTSNPLFSPTTAAARLIHHLYTLDPNDTSLPISLVEPGHHILAADITLAVRHSVVLGGLLQAGYSMSQVSAHSLRASGAMALKLNGHDEATIKKLGRWSSSTWLTYIHAQISTLTAGLSESMTVQHLFTNVA
jgi:integrase